MKALKKGNTRRRAAKPKIHFERVFNPAEQIKKIDVSLLLIFLLAATVHSPETPDKYPAGMQFRDAVSFAGIDLPGFSFIDATRQSASALTRPMPIPADPNPPDTVSGLALGQLVNRRASPSRKPAPAGSVVLSIGRVGTIGGGTTAPPPPVIVPPPSAVVPPPPVLVPPPPVVTPGNGGSIDDQDIGFHGQHGRDMDNDKPGHQPRPEKIGHGEGQNIEAISRASNRSKEEIEVMRESGLGWGKIARTLGVQPGQVQQNTFGATNAGAPAAAPAPAKSAPQASSPAAAPANHMPQASSPAAAPANHLPRASPPSPLIASPAQTMSSPPPAANHRDNNEEHGNHQR